MSTIGAQKAELFQWEKAHIFKEGSVFDRDGNAIKYKQWKFDTATEGIRCRWISEVITIFSNGAISDEYVLKNLGAFGDPSPRCFKTDFKIQDKAGSIIEEWGWTLPNVRVNRKRPREPSTEGRKLDTNAVYEEKFDQLHVISRLKRCLLPESCSKDSIS